MESDLFNFFNLSAYVREDLKLSPCSWLKKKGFVHIWVGSNEMDETRAYYTRWSQKEKKKYRLLTRIHGI